MSLERIADLKKWVRRRDEEIRNLLRKVDRLDGVIAEKDEVIRRLEVRIEDSERPVRGYIDIEVERMQAEWDGRHPAPPAPAPQQKKQLTEKQLANLAAGRAKLHGRAAS